LFYWKTGDSTGPQEPNPDHYRGKIIVLANNDTQSIGEFTTMALMAFPRTTVLGSPTAGADGNVSFIYLPGKITTHISGIGIYWPDKSPTQRIGIIPDIEVYPTINGIKQGLDEELECALEYARSLVK
jgi:C-terminal processing protease CtpA/Prc